MFALRLVGCDNVCCSSLVLSITAGSGRFPAVNSQSIYVPFVLVNSKKKGRSDFIVAFVDAPAGDQKLQLLPDHLFLENGKRVFIGVEGRDPQQRGFIPVGTPSPPPPPPPPARPSVASEPPASTRDREDPARGGVAILVRPGLAIVDPTVAFKDINGRLLMVKFSSEAGHPWAVLGVYDPVELAFIPLNSGKRQKHGLLAAPCSWRGISTVSHHNWMCRLNKQIQLKIAD